MKKNFAKIFLACLVCAVMLCVAVSAETTTVVPGDDGKYDVTYNGTSGEYYAILVVEGTYAENETPTISEDSIIYISQETAGADGNATFADFLPKTATNGTIYIGGSDLDEAVLFGYLSTGVEETATVSGKVTSSADSTWATKVVMTDTTDSAATYEVTTETETFSITLPLGTYKMEITKTSHLSYTDNTVEVAEDVTYDAVELKAGDADENGAIGVLDITALITDFGKSSGFVESCDINNDGSVGITDLTAIIASFGLSATIIE